MTVLNPSRLNVGAQQEMFDQLCTTKILTKYFEPSCFSCKLTDRHKTWDMGYQQKIIFRPGKEKQEVINFMLLYYSTKWSQAITN